MSDTPPPRRPGAFSPLPTTPTFPARGPHFRAPSSDSESSGSSNLTELQAKRNPYGQRQGVAINAAASASNLSLHNFSRPTIAHVVNEPARKNSPLNPIQDSKSHKRNNSQGFFEPSLPTASLSDPSVMSNNFTASQIAAQAAMQQMANQHVRKRSQTIPAPQGQPDNGSRSKPQPPLPTMQSMATKRPANIFTGSNTAAAAYVASAAYPGGGQLSPGLTSFAEQGYGDTRVKAERSKMKLFSKPKHIGLGRDKDPKDKPLPSPGKGGTSPGPSGLSSHMNVSTTSLVDPLASGGASLYSIANSSTSTLVPTDRQKSEDKERKHHFLSRQKNKLKDKIDDHSLNLSSASSNSKPIDPNAPQSIYNFTPSSPAPSQTTFSKSVSGLDLRHGGRALREKKREEKAGGVPILEGRRSDLDRSDLVGFAASFGGVSNNNMPGIDPLLHSFGLPNLTPEDAWDYMKAKLLVIFGKEPLKTPVEDMNRLVFVHIQRCVQKRSPSIVIEDLRDLLQTGFLSLEQTLRGVPDEKLVPFLVDMWLFVFGKILPYCQAVFLPLDLEFKGQGAILSPREASEFWGIAQDSLDGFENELQVRRIVLLSFRDNIILPRYDTLKAIFSRLSLESINVGVDSPVSLMSPRSNAAMSLDPTNSSFNSQSSTLLNDSGARSRATSNTSAPELPSFAPPQRLKPQLDSAQVTETVGRMLQCISVLASVHSGDDAQNKMEDLGKALKLNWLGRGRTGRNRKGFVGARVPRAAMQAQGNGESRL